MTLLHISCEQCGTRMEVPEEFAGQKGRCGHCGHAFVVSVPAGKAPAGAVAPVHFGAYSKAADEHWDDPSARPHEAPVNLGTAGVPPAVLEKHRARKRQQNRRAAVLAGGLILVASLFAGLGFTLGLARSGSPATPPNDLAPAGLPVPTEVAPTSADAPSTVTADADVVYVISGDTRYHKAGCPVGPAPDSPRHQLTHEQALAAGYSPCQDCKPAGYDTYYFQPLYERIDESESKPPVGPEQEEAPPILTVYVNPGETVVHDAGCEALQPGRLLISVEDAHARGYTPCPKCLAE